MNIIARIGLSLLTGGISEGIIVGRQIGNMIVNKMEEKDNKVFDDIVDRTEIDRTEIDRIEIDKVEIENNKF